MGQNNFVSLHKENIEKYMNFAYFPVIKQKKNLSWNLE